MNRQYTWHRAKPAPQQPRAFGDWISGAEFRYQRQQQQLSASRANLKAMESALGRVERLASAGSPDDLRAAGWTVAAHNDYRLLGVPHTLWLMTREGFALKGEGLTDAEALNEIREQVASDGK